MEYADFDVPNEATFKNADGIQWKLRLTTNLYRGRASTMFMFGYTLKLTMKEPVVAPEITMLNHLDVSIDDYIIKVRILMKWQQLDRKIPNEDGSIEMILIDEEIQVRVQHINDVVPLTIFDRDVTKVILKSARELLDGVDQDDDFLLDKKLAFKIEVSDFNLKNNYQVYGILKITNDSSILSELDKRVNIIHPNDSDSPNLAMSEFTSQDTTGMKVMSFSGDNSTPTLFTNVKRKLIEVYVLEEYSSVHSKKSLTIDDKENDKLNVASKRKLIIPKLEKF
ncbi:hypothetical protein E3N88_13958 [Mikania micrantha]|uniref:Uncharacterized protein n=1 Tax=Mikania micrantha TaxID=192012 RepID=A0A5N6P1B1_9ASTR|nr:hypothetical protein E3N88_13958 [Mikania micrantha]